MDIFDDAAQVDKRTEEERSMDYQQKVAELDVEFPLQDRVLLYEQVQAEKRKKEFLAEVYENTPDPLPSLTDRLIAAEGVIEERLMTGFTKLDSLVGGFRTGNTYLVAGLEKSGKSALLMNFLDQMLKAGTKVGYINTELRDMEFINRMAAIRYNMPISEVENRSVLTKKWVGEVDGNFKYAGIESPLELKKDNMLSFTKTLEVMNSFVMDGAKVIMLDNLTTYSTMFEGNKRGWEILGSCITNVVNFAKEKKVAVFIVIHTKPNVVFGETPAGVRNIVSSDPAKIFDDSVTVTRKPTLSDVYGGGSALSQLSGALMVWRPYQKFDQEFMRRMTHVVLDSFRHAASGSSVSMGFDGAKSLFTEEKFATLEDKALEAFK